MKVTLYTYISCRIVCKLLAFAYTDRGCMKPLGGITGAIMGAGGQVKGFVGVGPEKHDCLK